METGEISKQEVFDLVSRLRYGDDKRECFVALRDYLQRMDPNLNTRFMRRLESAFYNTGNRYGDILYGMIRGDSHSQEDLMQENGMIRLAQDSGISQKEFEEAKSFFDKVCGHFKKDFEEVYDLCSGNGLDGYLWLSNGHADKVHFYDIKENSCQQEMGKHFPGYELHLCDLFKEDVIVTGNSLVISIHACGNLTDRVIDLAIGSRKPFAVMPCCYEFHNNPYFAPELMDHFNDKQDAIDSARVIRAKERGYDVSLKNIPKEITDKNRIIIGVPEGY